MVSVHEGYSHAPQANLRRRRTAGCVAATLSLTACATSAAREQPARLDAIEVVRALDRLATSPLWPGFDPVHMPLAIYDGRNTLVFRHPGPLPEFRELDGRPGAMFVVGRHPAVTANSNAPIGGRQTATLLDQPISLSPKRRAAIAIHELFHVFQRTRHPGWSANEVNLFVYPVDDVRNLALRRIESDLLRQALVAQSKLDVACWAAAAIDVRRERYQLLDSASVNYERKSELNEGLASYVQSQASGEAIVFPPEEFAPEDVRQRSYVSGAAFAFMLDRLMPGWKDSLEQRDDQSLDEIAAAVPRGTRRCALEPGAKVLFDSTAEADVRDLAARRVRIRNAFLTATGWQLVVETGNAPLFPQSFDPLNVTRLTASDVLHSRFIRVGSAAGSIEVLGHMSITEGIGSHPMFSGIRRVTVAGLFEEPVIGDSAGSVTVRSPGVSATFTPATVERQAKTVTLRLR